MDLFLEAKIGKIWKKVNLVLSLGNIVLFLVNIILSLGNLLFIYFNLILSLGNLILSLVNLLLFLVNYILSWDGLMPWWYLGMLWQLKLHTRAEKGDDSKSGDFGITQRSQETMLRLGFEIFPLLDSFKRPSFFDSDIVL